MRRFIEECRRDGEVDESDEARSEIYDGNLKRVNKNILVLDSFAEIGTFLSGPLGIWSMNGVQTWMVKPVRNATQE